MEHARQNRIGGFQFTLQELLLAIFICGIVFSISKNFALLKDVDAFLHVGPLMTSVLIGSPFAAGLLDQLRRRSAASVVAIIGLTAWAILALRVFSIVLF